MARRHYEDDDGRTIADMSQVSGVRSEKRRALYDEDPTREPVYLTSEEKRWYVLGALKSALLIGGAFIVGLGLVILLLILLWS